MTSTQPILTPTLDSIPSIQSFKEIIESNTGTIIIKFGAEWCGPCKKIDAQVHKWFEYLSKTAPTIQTYLIDVDDNIDIYGYLKTKKMVNGIPAILVYKSPNKTYIPDDSVLGANSQEIDLLFRRCLNP
jgi:thiol-disulfide isomerase/thioredoxin